MIVPCGKCLACRVNRSEEWAMRLVHEMGVHDDSVFCTLTYDNDHLPADSSLSKRDLVLFIKRLRKSLEPKKIKYFACGEYGDGKGERKGLNPHYHLILFGVSYTDFEQYWINGKPYYRNAAWSNGHLYLGSVTYQSCRYTAKYLFKIFSEEKSEEEYGKRERPFKICSKGLGLSFAQREALHLVTYKQIHFRGKAKSVPRYYRKKLGIIPDMLHTKEMDYFWKQYDKFCINALGDMDRVLRLMRNEAKQKIINLERLHEIKGGRL